LSIDCYSVSEDIFSPLSKKSQPLFKAYLSSSFPPKIIIRCIFDFSKAKYRLASHRFRNYLTFQNRQKSFLAIKKESLSMRQYLLGCFCQ